MTSSGMAPDRFVQFLPCGCIAEPLSQNHGSFLQIYRRYASRFGSQPVLEGLRLLFSK